MQIIVFTQCVRSAFEVYPRGCPVTERLESICSFLEHRSDQTQADYLHKPILLFSPVSSLCFACFNPYDTAVHTRSDPVALALVTTKLAVDMHSRAEAVWSY
eukprot:4632213-Amphidinium_carterae.2